MLNRTAMSRIGLVGACDDAPRLRRAFELLLREDCDPIVYLGPGDFFDAAVRGMPGARVATDEMFLRAAAAVALRGNAQEIEGLLAAEKLAGKLARLRALPPAPALAVEMLEERLVILVHDKAILTEDDIASAAIIAHEAPERGHRRIGPRHFVSPGPLDSDGGVVALLRAEAKGGASLCFARLDGRVDQETALAFGVTSRMIVTGTA